MERPNLIAYRITNSVNGKCYIGITTQPLQRRWTKHQEAATYGRRTKLAYAMRKHGLDAFSIEPIASAMSRDDLLALEIQLVAQENSRNRGYNMTIGGDGARGLSPSAETRAKLSKANIGKKQSAETIAKRNLKLRGMKMPPRSAEWRAHRSAIMTGRKGSPLGQGARRRISEKNAGAGNGMFGRGHTEEARAKIAEANRIAGVEYISRIRPAFDDAAQAGLIGPGAVADFLNRCGLPTRNGALWTASAVCYVRRRFRAIEDLAA